MSADVARLGLSIDSSQVAAATTALGAFQRAAGGAEKAAMGLTAAGDRGRDALGRFTAAGKVAADAADRFRVNVSNPFERLPGQVDKAGKSIGLMRHELVTLGRQAPDVIGGLLGGQSVFQVLIQQGPQIADVFATTTGTMRGFFGQLASLVTPARLFTVGIVGTGAALAASALSLKTYGLAVDDTARRVGTAVSEISKLQATAGFKGIGGDDFTKAAGAFSAEIYRARAGVGDLATLLRTNGVPAVRDFEDGMGKIADLVQRAKGDTERQISVLQQAGVPATMQWVRYLEGGAAGLRAAKAEAHGFGDALSEEINAKFRQFDESLNKFTTNFGLRWRGAFVDTVSGFEWLSDKATAAMMRIPGIGKAVPTNLLKDAFATGGGSQLRANSDVSSLYDRTGADTATRLTVSPPDPRVEIARLTRINQEIGLLGNLATSKHLVQVRENELRIAYLQSGASVGQYADAIKRQVEFQHEAQKIGLAITYGIFDHARAARTASLEIQSLRDQGIIKSFDDQQAAIAVVNKRLREMGESAIVARSNLEGVTRYGLDAANSFKQWDSAAVSAFGNIENSFAGVVSGTRDIKSAFADMTSSILSDLAKLAIRQSITGPLAGLIGGAFGGGNPTGFATNPWSSAGMFGIGQNAEGTDNWRGGLTWVGEKGPELLNIPRGAQIIPNDVSTNIGKRTSFGGAAGQGGGGPINVSVNVSGSGVAQDSRQSATAKSDGRGGLKIDLLIDSAVASSIRSREGDTYQAIKDTFGAKDVM